MVVEEGAPALILTEPSTKASSYRIDTGSDFAEPNDKYLIGLGKRNSFGLVSLLPL